MVFTNFFGHKVSRFDLIIKGAESFKESLKNTNEWKRENIIDQKESKTE